MATPYIGEIRMFGGTFPPVNYVSCNGQMLAISQYSALYQLLGTTYGGDGVNTFGVPDLRGRIPLHQGTGPSLPNFVLGQSSGSETVGLTVAQLPDHIHPAAGGGAANSATPAGNLPGVTTGGNEMYTGSGAGSPVAMAVGTLATAGASQPHDNMMPYQVLNFIMAVEGLYPSQN